MPWYYHQRMTEREPPISFRPNEDDRKRIADLMRWLGLNVASVFRLALKRLHDEESKRQPAHTASAQNTRKR